MFRKKVEQMNNELNTGKSSQCMIQREEKAYKEVTDLRADSEPFQPQQDTVLGSYDGSERYRIQQAPLLPDSTWINSWDYRAYYGCHFSSRVHPGEKPVFRVYHAHGSVYCREFYGFDGYMLHSVSTILRDVLKG